MPYDLPLYSYKCYLRVVLITSLPFIIPYYIPYLYSPL